MAFDLGVTQYVTEQRYDRDRPSAEVQPLDPAHWSNSDAAKFAAAMIHQTDRRQDRTFKDFVSLYSVTQKGADGSRDALASHIQGSPNTAKVLNALFGDGTQENGLINGVLIGGNVKKRETYPDIRHALWNLGFVSTTPSGFAEVHKKPLAKNTGPHYNHFHIILQPPARKPIQTSNLLLASNADGEFSTTSGSDTLVLAAATKTITPAIVREVNKTLANECVASENQTYRRLSR